MDNIASSLLFSDGAAAMLMTPDHYSPKGMHIDGFYSEVLVKGKKDMAWELSSTGFLMKLSGYIPELIEEDFEAMVTRALNCRQLNKEDISSWCIHPGGKRILEAINKSLSLENGELDESFSILKQFGNMSSPTILFVLKNMIQKLNKSRAHKMFGAAFGPGLTMETFIISNTYS